MVFQGVPKNLQDKTIRAFDAAIDLCTLKPFGPRNNSFQTTCNGLFKGILLTRCDANVGKFENHEIPFDETGVGEQRNDMGKLKSSLFGNPQHQADKRHGDNA